MSDSYGYGMGWWCPEDKVEDWAFRRSDGTVRYAPPGSALVCWNSPYREYAIGQIEDYVKKNPSVKSVFLDAVWWGVHGNYGGDWCCCDHCKKAFKEKFGEDLPVADILDWGDVSHSSWGEGVWGYGVGYRVLKLSPSDMKRAIEWRRDTLEEIYTTIRNKIKAIQPNIDVLIHGLTSFHIDAGNLYSRINSLRMSDIAHIESYHNEIFYAAWVRGVSKRPTSIHTSYAEDPSSVQPPIAGYSDDVLKAVTSGMLAHGCYSPETLISNDTKNSKYILELVDREVREKRQYVEGASPVFYAAIVYSEAVKTYYRRNDPERSPLPHIQGAFEVFQRLRVPVEFLCDMDLDLKNLKKFKVVVLPNVAILSEPQVEAIHQYVKEGGSILSTFETSLCDELGEMKRDFDLADVFGLKFKRVEAGTHPNSWGEEGKKVKYCIAPREDFLVNLQDLLAPHQNESLRVDGPIVISKPVEGTTKATVTFPTEETSVPAVHFNTFGKGKTVYFSSSLYKLYTCGRGVHSPIFCTYSFPFSRRGWITDLTREVLEWLAPNSPFKVEGSPLLAATFFEQKEKNRLIVHLLNSGVAELGTVFSLRPSKIMVRKDFVTPRKVFSAWPRKEELKILKQKEWFEISVPDTDIHQIVILER